MSEQGVIELSIVICTRNRAGQLAGMLDSLARIETARAWEIVLVDNGSTDRTAATIEEARPRLPNMRYVFEPRPGLGAARHRGWQEACGEIVALTDDDCYVQADYVDAVLTAFAEHRHVGCIGGRVLLFDPEDAPATIDTRNYSVDFAPRRFIPPGAMHGANLAFRRATLQSIGGIDPLLGAGTPFSSAEDIDAIAATLWSGVPARFDPRTVVYHHHRRRAADIPALDAGYHRGRGAYFAKYLMRRDTRLAYLAGWLASIFWSPDFSQVRRELASARRYVDVRGGRLTALLSLVAVAAVPIVIAGRIVAWTRRSLRRIGRAAARPQPDISPVRPVSRPARSASPGGDADGVARG